MSRLGWLDLSCGVSGDMLLGALVGAGVPLAAPAEAVGALGLPVELRASTVRRAGLAATRVEVVATAGTRHRRWREVWALLERATLTEPVRARALATFAVLAAAEAAVHGVPPEEVHFHEVGALDALADVVGVGAGLVALGLDRLVASPVALGGGTVTGAHGTLPVPAPAVLELLRRAGVPAHGGPVDVELCTPTGAALLVTGATAYGPLPPLRVESVGVGAGARDLPDRPNVARLVVGTASRAGGPDPATELLVEANVDDLDPRAWPAVLAALLAAGAVDAWLTPILMKKGRPAHTLSALVGAAEAEAVRRAVFTQTTTLGVRESRVAKRALDREVLTVTVDGRPVRVKVGRLPDGTVVNAQPEWDDVARVAADLGRPVKVVLARATGAALTAYGAAPPATEDR